MTKILLSYFWIMMLVLFPLRVDCLDSVIGVKGGLGHFSYAGEDYRDYLESADVQNAVRLAFAAAVFATLEISQAFAFQAEILLLRAGDACIGDASVWDDVLWGPYYGQVKYIDKTTYLAVPVLAKIHFGRVSLMAGPTLMVKMGSGKSILRAEDEWLDYDFESTGLDSMEYTNDVFSCFLLAAAIGIGIEFPVGRRGGIFLLETRGHYVFTNVLGESQGQTFQAYGVIVMAGYGWDAKARRLIRSKVR
jgi:hypothetical protein